MMLNGDLYARKKLIESQVNIVDYIARSLSRYANLEDLKDEGYDTLIKIIDRGDNINENSIMKYIHGTLRRFIKIKKKQQSQNISIETNISGIENLTYQETIASPNPTPDEEVENKLFNQSLIEEIKSILNNAEYKILCLHLGLTKSGKSYSIEDIAQKFSTTEEKISKIFNSALKKLKTNLNSEWNI